MPPETVFASTALPLSRARAGGNALAPDQPRLDQRLDPLLAEPLGQLDGLVDHYAIGDLRVLDQFVGTEAQDRPLDRVDRITNWRSSRSETRVPTAPVSVAPSAPRRPARRRSLS